MRSYSLRITTIICSILLFALITITAQAQTPIPLTISANTSPLWQNTTNITSLGDRSIIPTTYRVLALNTTTLHNILATTPLESTTPVQMSSTILTLPVPDGRDARFRLVNSPIMAPELAAQFPQIQTYLAQGIDDPTATARLDWTPQGFHAIILSSEGIVYIDPYQKNDTTHYISYYAHDYQKQTDSTELPLLTPTTPLPRGSD
ncbi:MAG TPA: hypothetical protein VLL52_25075, partial [Anaerolineae bacterium]|nr:hypothetical protein [Anaerolineae bacterium]